MVSVERELWAGAEAVVSAGSRTAVRVFICASAYTTDCDVMSVFGMAACQRETLHDNCSRKHDHEYSYLACRDHTCPQPVQR